MTDDAAGADGATSFRFSTAAMPLRSAFDLYRSVFDSGAEVGLEGEGFGGEMAGRRFARMVVYQRRLHDVSHTRDAAQVRRSDFSHFTMTLCLGGRVSGRSQDDCIDLRPGQLLLMDMQRPAILRMTNAHLITVAVAREVVEAATGDPRTHHARTFGDAETAPLRRYLLELVAAPDAAMSAAGILPCQHLSDQLQDMVRADLTTATPRDRARRLLAAHRVIEERIGDPYFGVEDLARTLQVSRATLYRLFEPLGGVSGHLLDRRMARLRRTMMAPGSATSFARLVEQAGLTSESHVSRVFRSRYGERPGAHRRRISEMSDGERVAAAMRAWSDELR